jgi:hypothetical protein
MVISVRAAAPLWLGDSVISVTENTTKNLEVVTSKGGRTVTTDRLE